MLFAPLGLLGLQRLILLRCQSLLLGGTAIGGLLCSNTLRHLLGNTAKHIAEPTAKVAKTAKAAGAPCKRAGNGCLGHRSSNLPTHAGGGVWLR